MTHPIIHEVEKAQLKKKVPQFNVGDTVEVRIQIQEGDRERIQPFIGTVIARKGGGLRETFTVRRIVQGEGVERVFQLHSPSLVGIGVRKKGEVRRAKLYYLRDRVGKRTRVKGRIIHGQADEPMAPAEEAPPSEEAAPGEEATSGEEKSEE